MTDKELLMKDETGTNKKCQMGQGNNGMHLSEVL